MFDAAEFDARLRERALSRRAMAAAAGMSQADLTLAFKDQRELSAGEVAAFAELPAHCLCSAPSTASRSPAPALRVRNAS